MNFIHFIKEESSHSIEKLQNNNSKNDTKSYINHNKHTWIENLNSTNNNDQMIDKNVETVDFLDLNKVMHQMLLWCSYLTFILNIIIIIFS